MPPKLHLMRHGQGYHSEAVTKDGHQVRDAVLTEKGKEQCRQRSEAFKRHDQIELLLASPLRRALQTAQLTFPSYPGKIVAFPYAEECSDAPCDTGSPVADLRKLFPDVDFDLVKEGWFEHQGEFALEPPALLERARILRQWVKARKEKEVVMVAHGFFNHFITGEVNERGEQTTPWWAETELRTYTFSEEDDDNAMVYETPDSLAFREQTWQEDAEEAEVKLNRPSMRSKSVQLESS